MTFAGVDQNTCLYLIILYGVALSLSKSDSILFLLHKITSGFDTPMNSIIFGLFQIKNMKVNLLF